MCMREREECLKGREIGCVRVHERGGACMPENLREANVNLYTGYRHRERGLTRLWGRGYCESGSVCEMKARTHNVFLRVRELERHRHHS